MSEPFLPPHPDRPDAAPSCPDGANIVRAGFSESDEDTIKERTMTDEASGREPCPITAELIARADAILAVKDAGKSMMPESPWEIMRAMRAALAAQAQEIERLKTALTAARNRIEDDAQTIDRHVAKIGKLQNALIGRDG
jgi:hypothetical protein